MKKIPWEVGLGISLVLTSFVLHLLHYFIFRDWHHVFIYLLGDIAFLPIEVLFVVLIIERLLSSREKLLQMEKLNMVINSFFSQTGSRLLKMLVAFDTGLALRQTKLNVQSAWTRRDFQQALQYVQKTTFVLDSHRADIEKLHSFLQKEKDFLLRLLENPVLLEHESFTEMLWAVFHLEDELAWRDSLKDLPEADYNHLSGDLERAYKLMVREWLCFLQNLQKRYQFLFSLAVRTNPFNPEATAVIK